MIFNDVSDSPSVNRMLAEKLQTSSRGCNCQRMMMILVQNGEIISEEIITPTPKFLEKVKTGDSIYDIHKIGESFYAERSDLEDGENRDFDINLMHIPRLKKHLPTFFINGEYYHQTPCDYSDEAILEDLGYGSENMFENFPNGIYYVLAEVACFSYSTVDGAEGDTECDYKIYPFVPLWEYLHYKDDLIVEAIPESEELVSAYLYIQDTKQKPGSIKEEDQDLPWNNSKTYLERDMYGIARFRTISPSQFVDGSYLNRRGES